MEDLIELRCVRPGGGAYLVDGGRPGLRHLGVPRGGAADVRAAARARELLELPPDATLLECTRDGGQWLISGQGQFVITGADLNWRINGRPVELYTTLDLDGDYLLDGGPATIGCRSYLGIRGRWRSQAVMGSVCPGVPGVGAIEPGWSVAIEPLDEIGYGSDLDIDQHLPELPLQLRVRPGPEWGMISDASRSALLERTYSVGPDSNRQGVRLKAESPLPADSWPERISSPVLPGTIQLTPSGPVVLLNDAQTIGGFPRILLLEDYADLGVLAQLRPGDKLTLILKKAEFRAGRALPTV